MTTEKKLIVYGLLAMIMGVCSILPLGVLMTTTAKAEASSEPWFDINIPYAYMMTKNGTRVYTNPDVVNPFNETNSVTEQHYIALNFTLNIDPTKYPADARIEYFRINVSSDKGPIGTMNWWIGTKSKSSFTTENFHFMRDEWFDTNLFDTHFTIGNYSGVGVEVKGQTIGMASGIWGGALMRSNWTAGLSILWPEAGSKSGTVGNTHASRIVSAIREAETLRISIQRIGWVTFTANSTEVTLANDEVVDQIQLEKFDDGFLYNTLVPEDELSTIDLLRPFSSELP